MGTCMTNFRKLSIIIPIFNERETLTEVIKQVQAVTLALEKEIILVDDCLTDGTRQLIESELGGDTIVKVYHHVN